MKSTNIENLEKDLKDRKIDLVASQICTVSNEEGACRQKITGGLTSKRFAGTDISEVHKVGGNKFIMKIIKPDSITLCAQFLREINLQALSKFINEENKKYIMPIEDCCVEKVDGIFKFFTKSAYLQYGDLDAFLKSKDNNKFHGRFDWKWNAAFGIVEGVTQLHGAGYLHRDLSLKNVLMTSAYDAALINFNRGINAKFLASQSTDVNGEKKEPSFATDIYALGKILFQIFNSINLQTFNEFNYSPIDMYCNYKTGQFHEAGVQQKGERAFYCTYLSSIIEKMVDDDLSQRPKIEEVRAKLIDLTTTFDEHHEKLRETAPEYLGKNPYQGEERDYDVILQEIRKEAAQKTLI